MKLLLKAILCGALTFAAWVPFSAAAADLSLGAGGVWVSSPYKDHDDIILPFPIIKFENECFYIRGASAGMHIYKDEMHEVSVGVSYSPFRFDPHKTDDKRLKQLDDRYSTMNVDLLYQISGEYGVAGVRLSHDALGNSDGFSGDVWYRYPIQEEAFTVTPGIGLRWDSADQTDYYFGISGSEANKSGLSKYSPDDAFSPYLSLAGSWEFYDDLSLNLGSEVLFLDSEIKNSPMVDDSVIYSLNLGVAYNF